MISNSLKAFAFAATMLLGAGWPAAAQEANQHTMQQGQGTMGQGTMGQGAMGQGMMGPGMMGMMHGMMHGQGMMNMGSGDEGVASLAFRGANMKMHRDMAIEYTGDADVDFVKGMMPHHQGAIDMAKIVLVFGKSPEIKKLAEEIIAAQEKEVAWMKDWLAENAK